MSDIRIGIIGSGGMARHHAHGFSQTEGCELVAIAARNPETGPALAHAHGVDFFPTYREMLNRDDIDAIAICTHNDTHGEIAIAALFFVYHIYRSFLVDHC